MDVNFGDTNLGARVTDLLSDLVSPFTDRMTEAETENGSVVKEGQKRDFFVIFILQMQGALNLKTY